MAGGVRFRSEVATGDSCRGENRPSSGCLLGSRRKNVSANSGDRRFDGPCPCKASTVAHRLWALMSTQLARTRSPGSCCCLQKGSDTAYTIKRIRCLSFNELDCRALSQARKITGRMFPSGTSCNSCRGRTHLLAVAVIRRPGYGCFTNAKPLSA
jgi:hypothetical protein